MQKLDQGKYFGQVAQLNKGNIGQYRFHGKAGYLSFFILPEK